MGTMLLLYTMYIVQLLFFLSLILNRKEIKKNLTNRIGDLKLQSREISNLKKRIPYTVMFYAMLGKKNKQTKYLQQEMVVDILAVAMYIPSLQTISPLIVRSLFRSY